MSDNIVNLEQKQAEEALRQMASRRANAEPLPGPLADTFCKSGIEIGPYFVRKFVARDFVILKAIDSPLHRMILELSNENREDINYTDEESWDICWQFTNTVSNVKEVFAKGKESLRKLSEVEFGDNEESAAYIQLIVAAVMEQLKRHASTMVKHAAEVKEKGEITFFRDTEPTPKMASAG